MKEIKEKHNISDQEYVILIYKMGLLTDKQFVKAMSLIKDPKHSSTDRIRFLML